MSDLYSHREIEVLIQHFPLRAFFANFESHVIFLGMPSPLHEPPNPHTVNQFRGSGEGVRVFVQLDEQFGYSELNFFLC
jgi:hypothetical protein